MPLRAPLVNANRVCQSLIMRVLGIDAPRGWAILNVPLGKASLIALGTLDAGRETDELAELVAKYHVERVGIETPLEAYAHGRGSNAGEGVRRAITISLIAVSRLAGRLEERAHVLRLPIVIADADHVRRALSIRGRSETERDAAVKAHVRLCVAGWPARTNADERDAAAMAIYAARQNGASALA